MWGLGTVKASRTHALTSPPQPALRSAMASRQSPTRHVSPFARCGHPAHWLWAAMCHKRAGLDGWDEPILLPVVLLPRRAHGRRRRTSLVSTRLHHLSGSVRSRVRSRARMVLNHLARQHSGTTGLPSPPAVGIVPSNLVVRPKSQIDPRSESPRKSTKYNRLRRNQAWQKC